MQLNIDLKRRSEFSLELTVLDFGQGLAEIPPLSTSPILFPASPTARGSCSSILFSKGWLKEHSTILFNHGWSSGMHRKKILGAECIFMISA